MNGRLVDALVEETQAPGWHSVTWRATGVASGVYYVRLATGSIVRTQSLILLR